MEEAQSRELAIRDEALELLLKEQELELEGLKLEMETARNAEVAPSVSRAESVVKILLFGNAPNSAPLCPKPLPIFPVFPHFL